MDNRNTAQLEDTILHAWDSEVPQDDTVMAQPYFIQRHEISAASKLARYSSFLRVGKHPNSQSYAQDSS
jgi:hypothetical protein